MTRETLPAKPLLQTEDVNRGRSLSVRPFGMHHVRSRCRNVTPTTGRFWPGALSIFALGLKPGELKASARERTETGENLKGKAFPCGRARVSADPFCGGTPQRPESESADGFAVTG